MSAVICKYGLSCHNKTHQHLKDYGHPWLTQQIPICKYGPSCYRKNPDHFKNFAHPWQNQQNQQPVQHQGQHQQKKPMNQNHGQHQAHHNQHQQKQHTNFVPQIAPICNNCNQNPCRPNGSSDYFSICKYCFRKPKVDVCRNTKKIVCDPQFQKNYPPVPSQKLSNNDVKNMNLSGSQQKPNVKLYSMDSFTCARYLASTFVGALICVVNFACYFCPGGGWESGASAQEEDLFRCSDYFMTLLKAMYPLKKDEFIFSPVVRIIKDASYKLLNKYVPVSCIAIAALKDPKLDKNGFYVDQKDEQTMQDKIDAMFLTAIKNKQEILVTGAIGCGAYGNNPWVVAGMFKKSLAKYGGHFKLVAFAIPPGQNQDVFSQILNLSPEKVQFQ